MATLKWRNKGVVIVEMRTPGPMMYDIIYMDANGWRSGEVVDMNYRSSGTTYRKDWRIRTRECTSNF